MVHGKFYALRDEKSTSQPARVPFQRRDHFSHEPIAALHQRLAERRRDRNPPVLVAHSPVAILAGHHVLEPVGQWHVGPE